MLRSYCRAQCLPWTLLDVAAAALAAQEAGAMGIREPLDAATVAAVFAAALPWLPSPPSGAAARRAVLRHVAERVAEADKRYGVRDWARSWASPRPGPPAAVLGAQLPAASQAIAAAKAREGKRAGAAGQGGGAAGEAARSRHGDGGGTGQAGPHSVPAPRQAHLEPSGPSAAHRARAPAAVEAPGIRQRGPSSAPPAPRTAEHGPKGELGEQGGWAEGAAREGAGGGPARPVLAARLAAHLARAGLPQPPPAVRGPRLAGGGCGPDVPLLELLAADRDARLAGAGQGGGGEGGGFQAEAVAQALTRGQAVRPASLARLAQRLRRAHERFGLEPLAAEAVARRLRRRTRQAAEAAQGAAAGAAPLAALQPRPAGPREGAVPGTAHLREAPPHEPWGLRGGDGVDEAQQRPPVRASGPHVGVRRVGAASPAAGGRGYRPTGGQGGGRRGGGRAAGLRELEGSTGGRRYFELQ